MKQLHRPRLIMRAGGFQTESVKNRVLCIHHMHAMLDHKSTSVVYYDWLRLQLQQTITVGAIQ